MNSVKLGSLMWEMAVQNSEFLKGLRLAGMAVDTFAGDSENKLDKVKGAFAAVGLVVAGIAVKAGKALFNFGKEAVALASAAEEAGSKFNVVFGAGAQKMEADLAAMADVVQRSKYELKEMAASVQDVFVPMGFAREEAQKLSLSLTQLAVDVGSFNNVADGEAMAAFQSALVGNHEAVRRFGIVISEATLAQELLNMGIEGGIQKATEQEKVQARLNLLFKMTSDAQGDAARTADSWANTQRGLESVIRDTTTAIGDRLLPILSPLLADFTRLAREVGPQLVDQVDMIARSFMAMMESLQSIDLSGVSGQFKQLSEALNVDFWASVFGFIGKQIALSITNFQQLAAELSRLGQEFNLLAQWIKGDFGFDEYRARMVALREDYALTLEAFAKTYEEINSRDWSGAIKAVTDVTETIHRNSKAMDELPAAWLNATAQITETAVPALAALPDFWAQMWEGMSAATAEYTDANQQRIMEYLQGVQQQMIDHGVAAAQFAYERDNALLALEAEYQKLLVDIQASGDAAQVATLQSAYEAKKAAILTFYNGRIATEKQAGDILKGQSRQQLQATLTMVKGEIEARKAAVMGLIAQTRATVKGFRAMAAAAMVYQQIASGVKDLAALGQAAAAIEALMDGMEGAIDAAANSAISSLDAWSGASSNLASSLGEAGSAMTNLTGPSGSGSGSQVRPQIIDPLEEAAKTAMALAQMVERAVAAFDALAEFGTPAAGWQVAMQALLDGLVEMVLAWGQAVAQIHAAGLIEKADELQLAAKIVSDVASALARAMDTLSKMDDPNLRPGVMRAWAQQIVAMVLDFRWLVDNVKAGGLSDADLEKLGRAAEQIVKVMAPWKAAADAVSAIASQAGTRIEASAAMLIWQARLLVDWVNWIINYLPEGMLRQVAARADEIAKALAPWKAAADAINAIASQAGSRIEDASQRLIWMAHGLIVWVNWLQNYLPVGMLEAVAARADEVVRALAPWKAAADAIQAIDDAAGAGVLSHSQRGQKMMWLVSDLIKWVNWVINYLPTGMLEQAAAQADEIVKALSPWKAAADAIQAIDDAGGAGVISHSGRGQKMMWLVYDLVKWVDWVIQYLPVGMLERVAAQADEIVKALSPWKAAAEAVEAVGQRFNLANIDSKAQLLMEAVEALALALGDMASKLGKETLEKAATSARLLSDALAPWEKAIKLADEMRAWRLMPDLEVRFMTFARQWISIIEQLGIAVAALDRGALVLVAQFGDALGALLSGMQAALNLALALPADWSVPDWEPFLTWVQDVFQSVYNWLFSWTLSGGDLVPRFDDGDLDIIGAFGEALSALMGGLQAALNLALALPETWVTPDWEPFLTWVQDVFQSVYNWLFSWTLSGGDPVPRFDDGDLDIIGAFGEALRAVMEGLRAALDLALALPAQWTEPASWAPFSRWVQDAFDVLAAYVQTQLPEDPEQAAIFEPVMRFGQALQSVMEGLRSALDLALALPAQWTEPASWAPFVQWVQDAFAVFVVYVEDYLPEDEDEALIFGPVAEFGNALGAVFGGLRNALDFALALPGTWQPPSAETWQTFTTWVQNVFDVFVEYVEDYLPEDENEALIFEPVAAFGNALGAVFGGLVAALNLFTGLEDWSSPDSVFQERLALFLDYVAIAFSDISTYVQANLTLEQMTAVRDFGDALGALVGGLSSALSLFAQLADIDPSVYTETHLFEDRVGHLLQAISGTLTAFSTWILNNAGSAWQAPAQDFYDAVEAVFQLLRDGLQLFADLQASGMPPTDLIQAFISTLLGVFGTFSQSLAGMAQPGGPIAGAISAIENLLSGFPASVAPSYLLWQEAGASLGGSLVTGLESKIGVQGQGSAAGTIWGALGAYTWTLQQWHPSQALLDAYYASARALGQSLVAGLLSVAGTGGEMWDAGYQVAQSGIEGFEAGSALANAMAGAMSGATPEWFSDFSGGASLEVNQTLTVRFEGAGGNPAGLDLTPRTIDAIARGLAEKVRRGG